MRTWNSGRKLVAALLLGALASLPTPTLAQESLSEPASEGCAVQVKTDEASRNKALEKKQLARLRGKLLYKKGQIRKLENGVTAASAELRGRVDELERQRRDLFQGAEPKLASLYEEHDQLSEQIRQAAEALKK